MTSPERPNQPGEPGATPRWRTAAVWVILALLLLAFGRLALTGRDKGVEIIYSDFSEQLQADNIARVEVNPESRQVGGSFKRPVTINGAQVTAFRVVLPF